MIMKQFFGYTQTMEIDIMQIRQEYCTPLVDFKMSEGIFAEKLKVHFDSFTTL